MSGTERGPVVIRVITWLPVGGIERRLVAIAPRLAARGWDVRVVCIREEGQLASALREQGIPVDVVPFRSRLSPGSLRRLARFFREARASVVHSHMYRANLPATLAGRWAGVPALFSQVHNVDTWETKRQLLMDRAVARWRTGTIAVSRAVQEDIMKRLGLPEDRVPLLYNGIDLDEFRPDAEARSRMRKELGLGEAQPLLLVPARLHPNKNPIGLLEAWREALGSTGRDGPAPPLLAFAGGGKLEEDLRRAVEHHGLGESVRLLGSSDRMTALYNAADCVVMSSFREGFSNAVVEALACGKPVIASGVGGNAEAIDPAETGWIHASGDRSALASQMRHVLELGVAGLAARAEACRARAGDFGLDALVERTHRLYAEAIGHEP